MRTAAARDRGADRSWRATVVRRGLAVAARLQEAAHRLAHRCRDLRRQRLARQLRGLPVGLEERHTVGALREMSTEADLIVVGQDALDVVQTELDQLVTVHRALVDRGELVD